MLTFFVINGILLGIVVIILIAEKYLTSPADNFLTINGSKKYKVESGENILGFLNKQKLFIPSACGGKATCGFCKVKVLAGGGDILPTEEAFIGKEEAKCGTRLACQVKISGNVDVSMPEYLLNAEEFKGTVTDVISVTHDTKHVVMKLIDKVISYKPGQYVQLRVPGTDEYRAYSIANAPIDGKNDTVELVVRVVPGGLCTGYVHSAMEPGDIATFTGPFGDFYLREDTNRLMVGIAGGSGMAPLRAIAQYMAMKGMPREFYFFFGARRTRDLYFEDELYGYDKKFPNFHYIPALSEPTPEDKWKGETGFITQTANKILDNTTPKEGYLCGPPVMIDVAIATLIKKGMKSGEIFFDKF